jgi:hypothetical protein
MDRWINGWIDGWIDRLKQRMQTEKEWIDWSIE